MLLADGDRPLDQFLVPTLDGSPVRVVADHGEDDDAVVLTGRPEEDPGDAEDAVVVVGAHRQECRWHGGPFREEIPRFPRVFGAVPRPASARRSKELMSYRRTCREIPTAGGAA